MFQGDCACFKLVATVNKTESVAMKYVLFAILFLSNSLSRADEKPLEAELQKKTTSEMNRQDKSFEINGLVAGVGIDKTQEGGFVLGYYLNPQSIIEFDFGVGEDGDDLDITKKRTHYAGIMFKRFFGNSFYARGGFKYHYMNALTDYAYGNGYEYKGERFSGVFAVGNQWQWKNFTFGIDWISVSGPISARTFDERINGENYYQNTLDYVKDRFTNDSFITSPNIYIGASF